MASSHPVLECVPNFSEGRRAAFLDELRARFDAVRGLRLLDLSMDADHHRAVATLVGSPAELEQGLMSAIAHALETIDLRDHAGVHPRLGATDVVPFVPLREADEGLAIETARLLAERVGTELELPVYLYGAAARRAARRELPFVRKGGLERLRTELGRDPELEPDAGPARLHPSAGALAIGVRPFLIAFNVNLETTDLELARSIASQVRASGGGLPGIRALGFPLARAGCVQVSLNVCDHRRTSLLEVFERIEELAARDGVAVRESELIGLAPRAALPVEWVPRLRLRDFDPSERILESILERR